MNTTGRAMKRLAMLAPLALLGANAPIGTTVSVNVNAMRDSNGFVRMCLTGNAAMFPKKCDLDPAAKRVIVKASDAGTVVFHDVPPGRYAIALLHDENGNGKMDWSFIGMPKEGFGFSRDAPVRLSAPKFDAAAFEVSGQPVKMSMKVRYLL